MPEMRECIRCDETKGIDSFRQYTKRVKRMVRGKPDALDEHYGIVRRKTYRHTVCRECEREYARKRSFEQRRGITHEERDAMLVEQGGVCAACGSDDPGSSVGWHVDHDHETGENRGILCSPCNVALGHARDCPLRLAGLILYLKGIKYNDDL